MKTKILLILLFITTLIYSQTIDTHNISSGIYILKIETESGKIAMKKIIKK